MSSNPNNFSIDLDDPRLTAWAIGATDDLSPEERRGIAAAVAREPALQAEVDAIRGVDGRLSAALAAAPVPGLSDVARAAILAPPGRVVPIASAKRGGRWVVVGGLGALAAAAALLVVALSPPTARSPEATLAAAEARPAEPQGATAASAPTGAPAPAPTPASELATATAAATGTGASAPTTDDSGAADAHPPRDPNAPRYAANRAADAPTAAADSPASSEAKAIVTASPAEPSQPDGGIGELANADPIDRDAEVGASRAAAGRDPKGLGLHGDAAGGGGVGGEGKAGPQLADGYHGVTGGLLAHSRGYIVHHEVLVVPTYEPEYVQRGVIYRPGVPWPFRLTQAAPLSTFSIDVDTASMSHARRYLGAKRAVPSELVRIEEIVNAFHYSDPAPEGDAPIAVHVEIAEAPWQPANRLVRVALTSRPVESGDRAPANLVFLIDTSGSMKSKSKLPLLVGALERLVDGLQEGDQVAIVTYASKAKVVLEPTEATHKDTIRGALKGLRAGGYTNGGVGLDTAYDLARKSFVKGGSNRVILATDGDFNAGRTSNWELERVIRDKARSGVLLSVLGFGQTGYDDARLEMLAKHGDGRYAFIDSLEEAERVLVRELDATLVTVARDVRVQVELNPSQALAYRLIGYENRAMAASEFNQEGKDAGDLGAGDSVVAFYEVMPAPGSTSAAVDRLRYQGGAGDEPRDAETGEDASVEQELMTVKVRWVPTAGGKSERLDVPVVDRGERLQNASPDYVFSAAAAAFAMKLQGYSDPSRLISWGLVHELVQQATAGDEGNSERRALLGLVTAAQKVYGGP